MTRFIAFTTFSRPGLHIWSEGTVRRYYMEPLQQPGLSGGFVAFDCELASLSRGSTACCSIGTRRAPTKLTGSRVRTFTKCRDYKETNCRRRSGSSRVRPEQ